MGNYTLSKQVKEDLIRIHHYGIGKFGMAQADKYFKSMEKYFETISQRPYSFESVDYIKVGYRRCVRGSDTIYFRVIEEKVEIMAIIGSQDLSGLL